MTQKPEDATISRLWTLALGTILAILEDPKSKSQDKLTAAALVLELTKMEQNAVFRNENRRSPLDES